MTVIDGVVAPPGFQLYVTGSDGYAVSTMDESVHQDLEFVPTKIVGLIVSTTAEPQAVAVQPEDKLVTVTQYVEPL